MSKTNLESSRQIFNLLFSPNPATVLTPKKTWVRRQPPPSPCRSVPFLEPNLDTDRIYMIYSRTKIILITIFHIFLTDFIFY